MDAPLPPVEDANGPYVPGSGQPGVGPKPTLAPLLMLVLVAALILVGVGAVAYTLGVNSGGNNTAAGMPGGAHPVQSPLPSGAAGFPRRRGCISSAELIRWSPIAIWENKKSLRANAGSLR